MKIKELGKWDYCVALCVTGDTGAEYELECSVDYEPADPGEREEFSTTGMIGRTSWGSPASESQIDIYEVFWIHHGQKIVMKNQKVLDKIREDDILEAIEDHLKNFYCRH